MRVKSQLGLKVRAETQLAQLDNASKQGMRDV